MARMLLMTLMIALLVMIGGRLHAAADALNANRAAANAVIAEVSR
jgi:hypothetical protein